MKNTKYIYNFPGVGMGEKRVVWDGPPASPEGQTSAPTKAPDKRTDAQKAVDKARSDAASAQLNRLGDAVDAALATPTATPNGAQKPTDTAKQPAADLSRMTQDAPRSGSTPLNMGRESSAVKPGQGGGLREVGNTGGGTTATAGAESQTKGPDITKAVVDAAAVRVVDAAAVRVEAYLKTHANQVILFPVLDPDTGLHFNINAQGRAVCTETPEEQKRVVDARRVR